MSSVSTITTEFNRIGIDKTEENGSTSINGGGVGDGDTDHLSSTSSGSNSNESKSAQQKHDFLVVDVPLGLIQRIEKLNSNSTFEFIGIMISCKVSLDCHKPSWLADQWLIGINWQNGRRLKLLKVANDQAFEKSIYETLVKYSFPISNNMVSTRLTGDHSKCWTI